MLKLVSDTGELGFLDDGPFSAVISALSKTYGAKYDFARFYVQGTDSALSIIDGNINIYATENTDYEELSEFLNITGYSSIRSDKTVIESLKLRTDDSSYIVRFSGSPCTPPEGFTGNCEFRDAYNLLVSCGFVLGNYEAFLTDICARINKGTACFGGIISDNTLSSCCFRLFDGDKSCLLGAVATHTDYRGKGLAGSLVPFMADSFKPSYLFTRNDSLLTFYENCGFLECGKWAVTYR